MTEESIAITFAFLVCALALYKLLYGVDTRPAASRRPKVVAPPPPATDARAPSTDVGPAPVPLKNAAGR